MKTEHKQRPKRIVRWINPHHARGLKSQNLENLFRGKPLTDRKIEQYRKLGFYSEAYREARRNAMLKNKAVKRVGSFLEVEPGRLIYSPAQ